MRARRPASRASRRRSQTASRLLDATRRRSQTASRLLAPVVLAGGAALAWGVGVEPRWFALRHATAPVLRADARAPLRVLHVSDLHLQPRHARLEAFLDACLRTGPDLVVVTGDILDHPDVNAGVAVKLLARLRGDRPGLVVLGSHDRYAPQLRSPFEYFSDPDRRHVDVPYDTDRLIAGLREQGWLVLDNGRHRVDSPAGSVDAVGLDDPHIDRDRPDLVDWTASNAPALRLGVVHAPYLRVLDRFNREGFDLVLAGHTHGGQVRVPLVGALTANCDLPLRKARGLSRHGRLWLHVSAGLGQSRYSPVRFACRPEATVLDLVHAEADQIERRDGERLL